MPEAGEKESYLELFDVSKKTQIAKVPLDKISHMPRAGERIFLPLHQPGDWETYTVVAVEYFIAGERSASQGPLERPEMVRVSLYVKESK